METYRVSILFITIAAKVANRPFYSCALGTLACVMVMQLCRKNSSLHKNKATLFTQERREGFIKATSTPALLPPTTVNRYIWHLCSGNLAIMCQTIVALIRL